MVTRSFMNLFTKSFNHKVALNLSRISTKLPMTFHPTTTNSNRVILNLPNWLRLRIRKWKSLGEIGASKSPTSAKAGVEFESIPVRQWWLRSGQPFQLRSHKRTRWDGNHHDEVRQRQDHPALAKLPFQIPRALFVITEDLLLVMDPIMIPLFTSHLPLNKMTTTMILWKELTVSGLRNFPWNIIFSFFFCNIYLHFPFQSTVINQFTLGFSQNLCLAINGK